jgi:TetR/AcrR family transcriptional regulator
MSRWNERVPTQDTQREIKTETLNRVAAAAFRRNGYHGTSLVDIATELGVSKATLYYYVRNKQDLFYQCHLAAAEQAIESVCDDDGLTGLERLKATLIGYIKAIICPESLSVVILEERSLTEKQLRAVIARRDVFDKRVRGLIEQGLRDGSMRACDAKLASFTVLGAANWVTKWHRPTGEWTVENIATGVANLLCGGLAAQRSTELGAAVSTRKSKARLQG